MYGISSEQYCINSSRRSDYIGSGCAGLKKHLEKEERRRLRVRLQQQLRLLSLIPKINIKRAGPMGPALCFLVAYARLSRTRLYPVRISEPSVGTAWPMVTVSPTLRMTATLFSAAEME